ncbi:MAG: hypothetical protein WCO45_11400 [Pseudanabaena sp. ELA607]|jgi:hypothetical protein
MTELRLLIVEDEDDYRKSFIETIKNVWSDIRVHPLARQYTKLVIEEANTTEGAKRLIKMQKEAFDLFILDISVKLTAVKSPERTVRQDNGLLLVEFADSEGKKPKTVICLSSGRDPVISSSGSDITDEVNSDLGEDYLKEFLPIDRFKCLHKGIGTFSASDRLASYLKKEKRVGLTALPNMLYLLLESYPFTVIYKGMDSKGLPIIYLYSSTKNREFPIDKRKTRLFLYFTCINENCTINLNELVTNNISKSTDSAQTEVGRIKDDLGETTGFDKNYIATYLVKTIHGQGYKVIAQYEDHSSRPNDVIS